MDNLLLVAASLHPGIGLAFLRKIVLLLHSNQDSCLYEIFKLAEQTIGKFPQFTAASIIQAEKDAQTTIALCRSASIHLITGSAGYPLLYAAGVPELFKKKKTIGIIGTRRPEPAIYTKAMRTAEELSNEKCTVVSGLAEGCDTAAHIGALRGPGSTIAVLPGGLLNIYPRANHALAEKIIEKGLLLSMFPPHFTIQKYAAIQRNALLTDLSYSLLLCQSSEEGGSKYAIRQALQQNKKIYVFTPETAGNCTLNRKLLEMNTAEPYATQLVLNYYDSL